MEKLAKQTQQSICFQLVLVFLGRGFGKEKPYSVAFFYTIFGQLPLTSTQA
jgi:hypothetical protein